MISSSRDASRIRATIETVAFGGDGVARVAQRVVFIPFTVEGDAVEAEITQVKKRYARGRLARLITPSPHRIAPACSLFGRCGGCRYQHISYAHELALKERQVAETFTRIGRIADPPVATIVPSPLPLGYRGKLTLHARQPRSGELRIGFVDVTGSELVDVERCALAAPSINETLGALRSAPTRIAPAVRNERLVLWSGEGEGRPVAGASGESYRRVPVCGTALLTPAGGFFQANTALTSRLVEEVVQACGLTGTETVLDCYCGSGLFSRFLAPAAAAVHGIEWDEEAVRCARLNLAEAGLANARFHAGAVGDVLAREFVGKGIRPDVIVLDPPRTGLDRQVLDAVAAIAPRTVVYVSCNPATQARDCRYLLDRGFVLRSLRPLDMFPRTAHIEVAGCLAATS